MTLQSAPQDRVPASRVWAPRRLIKTLWRLQLAAQRARRARANTQEEIAWCETVEKAAGSLATLGQAVLPQHLDPRDARKARKRTA